MGQWNVNGHLVIVEVSVERRCHEWVQLNRLTFDELRLERLDTKAVKCRSTVQKHRMSVDHRVENIPHFCCLLFDLLLCALHCLAVSALDQLANDKGLEQLNSHVLWKTAFVELEFWTHNDNRTTRVVDALTEKVLTEATCLTLERISKRLKCALRFAADGTT